jgi:uncharacterized protein (DUF983 family)
MRLIQNLATMHPTRLSALIHSRCPRCREGDMFERPAYRLDAFYKMYPECTHCGQDFMIEPGFYMGASYIGYGFTAIITVAAALGYVLLFPKANPWVVIAGILLVIGLLLPLIFRYGRTLMLHILGGARFDPGFMPKGLYVGEDGELRENEG